MELIDRDALCREITNDHSHNNSHNTIEELKSVWKHIENAPTVDAEPVRHGHWIEQTPEDRYSWAPWRCSVCKLPSGKHQTSYCPNCGAKMDEVSE